MSHALASPQKTETGKTQSGAAAATPPAINVKDRPFVTADWAALIT